MHVRDTGVIGCPSVCRTHAGIESKLMNTGSYSFHRRSLWFPLSKFHIIDHKRMASARNSDKTGWANTAKQRRFSTVNSYTLETIEDGHTVTMEDK